ncbi:CcdB family protein [Thauera mechernichensis]
MARFDVYANPGSHATTTPYLLDVQSDLLDGLDSRMVVPLRSLKTFPKVKLSSRLTPIFTIKVPSPRSSTTLTSRTSTPTAVPASAAFARRLWAVLTVQRAASGGDSHGDRPGARRPRWMRSAASTSASCRCPTSPGRAGRLSGRPGRPRKAVTPLRWQAYYPAESSSAYPASRWLRIASTNTVSISGT